MRTGNRRVARTAGEESAIGVPEQSEALPLLEHKQAVPAGMVRINHPDWTRKILGAWTEGLLGSVNKLDFDCLLVRLIEFERHSRLRVLAPLKGSGVDRTAARF